MKAATDNARRLMDTLPLVQHLRTNSTRVVFSVLSADWIALSDEQRKKGVRLRIVDIVTAGRLLSGAIGHASVERALRKLKELGVITRTKFWKYTPGGNAYFIHWQVAQLLWKVEPLKVVENSLVREFIPSLLPSFPQVSEEETNTPLKETKKKGNADTRLVCVPFSEGEKKNQEIQFTSKTILVSLAEQAGVTVEQLHAVWAALGSLLGVGTPPEVSPSPASDPAPKPDADSLFGPDLVAQALADDPTLNRPLPVPSPEAERIRIEAMSSARYVDDLKRMRPEAQEALDRWNSSEKARKAWGSEGKLHFCWAAAQFLKNNAKYRGAAAPADMRASHPDSPVLWLNPGLQRAYYLKELLSPLDKNRLGRLKAEVMRVFPKEMSEEAVIGENDEHLIALYQFLMQHGHGKPFENIVERYTLLIADFFARHPKADASAIVFHSARRLSPLQNVIGGYLDSGAGKSGKVPDFNIKQLDSMYNGWKRSKRKADPEAVKKAAEEAAQRKAEEAAKRRERAAELDKLVPKTAEERAQPEFARGRAYGIFWATLARFWDHGGDFYSFRPQRDGESDEDYKLDTRIEKWEIFEHFEACFNADQVADPEKLARILVAAIKVANEWGPEKFGSPGYRPSANYPKPSLKYLLTPTYNETFRDARRPIERILGEAKKRLAA